ncbi:MAG: DUF1016 family protein [Chlorobi bacterium]|nr:DUF1016 family protein [Chlorobiota bacterium]
MKKDISKLFNLLEQFKKNLNDIKLKEELSQVLDTFFAQKHKPIEDINKLNDVFSKIPDNQFVVDRLRLNIELKKEEKIEHYKKLFVDKYGSNLIDDKNYENLSNLIYFLGLLDESVAFELIVEIINILKFKSVNKEYIPFLEGYKLIIEEKYTQAIKEFDKATDIDNNFWYAFLYIAYTYFATKKYRIAISYFHKTLEFTEDIQKDFFVTIFLYLAESYSLIKDYKNTVKFLKKSLNIKTDIAHVNNLMGYSLYKLKMYNDALFYLDKSIELGKDGLYPYWNKIRVYKITGEFNKALEVIEILKTKTKSKKLLQNEIDSINKLKKKHKKRIEPSKVNLVLESEKIIEDEKEITFVPSPLNKKTSGIQLELEEILEDLLEIRLQKNKQTFGKYLKIYSKADDPSKYGRQFRTDTGRMDILTQNLEDNSYVIIELKRGKSDIEVVEQIQNYINWTINNLAKPGQAVKGIICIKEATNKLKTLVKSLPNIELFEYEFDFIKIA